jgi:hypothetical protein
MRNLFLILTLFLMACQSSKVEQKQAVDYVNPFVGTGGEMGVGFGNMFPGAAYPFGMIQLSPDNGGQNWMYCGRVYRQRAGRRSSLIKMYDAEGHVSWRISAIHKRPRSKPWTLARHSFTAEGFRSRHLLRIVWPVGSHLKRANRSAFERAVRSTGELVYSKKHRKKC